MDIINPQIRIIGRRFYRINPCESSVKNLNDETMEYRIDDLEETCDIEDDNEFDIQSEANGKFCGKLDVPSMLMGFIVGKKGESKKKIEMDTKTTIITPKMSETKPIIVKGFTYDSVVKALKRIVHLTEVGRSKVQFTHFFGVKVSNDVRDSFISFRESVLESCVGDRGICPELFQKPEKLHFTIVPIVLANQEESNSMINLIKTFKKEHSNYFSRPLKINVKGLEIMNDDPYNVQVLYGKIEEDEDAMFFQKLANDLSCYLITRKLARETERTNVKLHMTLMNTSYLEAGYDSSSIEKLKFNCENILKRFSEFDFKSFTVDKLDLLVMNSKSDDGFYKCLLSLNF